MTGGVNSGSVYGMRGGRGFYSRGRGGRGEKNNCHHWQTVLKMFTSTY